MFYCSAHDTMEDSDFVGIIGMTSAGTSTEYLETCDTYDGGEYRAMVAVKEPLPYDLPNLRKMRKLLMAHGGLTEYQNKIAEIEHRIWTLEDNRNHYE
jgi:hypothetical protein